MLQKLTFTMCVIQIKMEMKHKAAGKYEIWHILIFCAAQWLAINRFISLYVCILKIPILYIYKLMHNVMINNLRIPYTGQILYT